MAWCLIKDGSPVEITVYVREEKNAIVYEIGLPVVVRISKCDSIQYIK
jgi:hypothetical protein